MCLLGTSFGILLHRMTPEWIILLVLTVLLAYMTYTTGKKGIKLWKTETIKLQEEEIAREPKVIESEENRPKLKEVEIPGVELSHRDEDSEESTKN